jgi:hypothetical protein
LFDSRTSDAAHEKPEDKPEDNRPGNSHEGGPSIESLLSRQESAAQVSLNIQDYDAGAAYERNQDAINLGQVKEGTKVQMVGKGKHQLSSLLNLALSQEGAFESRFAQQKERKKLASARYGF